MRTFSDTELAIAKVYADALLDLAERAGEADSLLDELLGVAELVETNAEFAYFLSSPIIDTDERRASIEKMFRGRVSDMLVDALQVMNNKGRTAIVDCVAEVYRLSHEALRRRVDVHVTTATQLTDEMRIELDRVATEIAGLDAELVEHIDEDMIGGMVVQIGDIKYDMSVSTQLKKLGGVLADRASREIHGGTRFVEEAAS